MSSDVPRATEDRTNGPDAGPPITAAAPTPATAAEAVAAEGPSLTHRATHGFIWFILQTGGANVFNLLQVWVLGLWISVEQWGVFNMIMLLNALLVAMQISGISQVLVRRHAQFNRWANAGFWISLTTGLAIAAVYSLIAAPVAAWWFNEPRVMPLIWVLAASAPFGMLSAVPAARASGQLRFKLLAAVNFGWFAGTAVLSMVIAGMGFEAMSFVVPKLICDPIKLAVLWWYTRPPVRWTPQLRRWRHLLVDSLVLQGASILDMVIIVVELVILGRFHSAERIGAYGFAFRLSRHPLNVLSGNLVQVLFPALSTLQHDTARQVAAYLRAIKVLAIIGMPVCIGLAAVSVPALHALWGDKWMDAAPILAALSLGMAVRVVGDSAGSLLKAQGRFKTNLILNICYVVPFAAAVTLAAKYGDPNTVAVVVGLSATVLGPVLVYAAIRHGGGRKRDVIALYAGPTAASILAIGGAWLAAQALPEMPARDWAQLATIIIGSVLLYLPLIRLLAPDAFGELLARIRGLRRKAAAPDGE